MSSGPSERRNSAREPSPIARAERGAPQVNRKVRAFSPGNSSIASFIPSNLPTITHHSPPIPRTQPPSPAAFQRGQRKGNHYVFVIPIEAEIDFKKAAKVVGEKSLEMLHLKDLTKVTGYVRGGCTAIGMKKQFPTVIQEIGRAHV